ncbi:hypothetical protein DAPPUDRAFT_314845 [Daphnia pulex]|uniref:Uncharacterized protein n=1 Tax=Daphnia pulex TaxID=6669 RepID=E9G7P8_DAPPU|nr:hypothetical protein DAPPUDRAFT_314845 [Daphnia pulex]|eukprot:EFX84515.1 hypothetical protein DAPPUDRAFT_314845 [Daphnia pulex]
MAADCSSAQEAAVPPPIPIVQTQWHFVHPNTVTSVWLVPLHNRATCVSDWAPLNLINQLANSWLVPLGLPHSLSQTMQRKEFVTQAQLESFEKQLTSKLERELQWELVQYKKELQMDFKKMQEME